MQIDILSVVPSFFDGPLEASLLGRGRREGVCDVTAYDLHRWGRGRHGSVDEPPYGGGPGMVLRPDPFFDAVEELYGDLASRPHTVLLSAAGTRLTQVSVRRLAALPRLLVCCGRYEGVDQRVADGLAHEEISVGDYVLSGGEPAALVLIDAVVRLQRGVMGNAASADEESFGPAGLLEYPHYTRPVSYRGWEVPEVLRSGDHGRIAAWRRERALERTRSRRPDLLVGDGEADAGQSP